MILSTKNNLKNLLTMKTNPTKIVKLQSRIRISQKRFGGCKFVPMLNLSGVWLEHNGFNVGDNVEISIKKHRLTIKSLAR